MQEGYREAGSAGPHQSQPVLAAGEPLDYAQMAMVLVHGRGATAQDILTLASELSQPGMAYLAPQAAGNTWYPYPFTAPLADNEPWLSSALALLDTILEQTQSAGIPLASTYLLGFSQGACLALEYAARHPRRYGAVIGLSGALIGPQERTPFLAPGAPGLAGTPVFLGCGDHDAHIPSKRVEAAAQALLALGGDITLRLYPGMGHTINEDELSIVRAMLNGEPDRAGG
jgi:predicted esterase